MNERALKPVPPALPATIDGWTRFLKTQRTINDEVESIHVALLQSREKRESYQNLLWAVYDEQAVEGSLSCDNCLAAKMIRDEAVAQSETHPLGKEKLATISKALGVVLRRYHQSRRERRDMVDGELVPAVAGNDKE